jgi:hypothetical protein
MTAGSATRYHAAVDRALAIAAAAAPDALRARGEPPRWAARRDAGDD